MISTSCILRKITYRQNKIGVSEEVVEPREVGIIRIEKVYATEFYKAEQEGTKPTLRLVLSSHSYKDEPELIYKNIIYTITRAEDDGTDEVTLICSRKVKNVKKNS